MKRADYLLDAAVAVLLFGFALMWRLPYVPSTEVNSDMLDPLVQALLFLDGRDPAGSSNHLFGYGRYWSYVPLLARSQGGLLGVMTARAAVQALSPSLVYLACRVLLTEGTDRRMWTRAGPLVAAAALLANRGLLEHLERGAGMYFAVEWAAVAVLGISLLLAGRWRVFAAVLVGVSLPFAAMNHAYAAVLAGSVPVLCVVLFRQKDRRTLAALLGTLVAVSLPQAIDLLRVSRESVGGASLLEYVRSTDDLNQGVLHLYSLYLADRQDPDSALLFAAPVFVLILFAAGRRSGPGARAALLATCVVLSFGIFGPLSLVPRYVTNKHWYPLIPFLAVLLGTLPALLSRGPDEGSARSIGGAFWLVVSLGVLGVLALPSSRNLFQPVEGEGDTSNGFTSRLLHLSQVGSKVAAIDEGRWSVGLLSPPPPQLPGGSAGLDLLALMLDAKLRGVPAEAMASTWTAAAEGPTVLSVQGSQEQIDLYLTRRAGFGVKVLGGGAEHLLLQVADARAGRRWTARVCAPDPLLEGVEMRAMGYPEWLHILDIESDGVRIPPWVHTCVLDEWVRLESGEYPDLAGLREDPDLDAWNAESRWHSLDGLEIGRTEVRRGRWRECVADGACPPGAEAGDPWSPVTGVGPEEAAAFCGWLGGDLPTGQEWEAAAWRISDPEQRVRAFPWGDEVDPMRTNAYGTEDGYSGPAQVGSFPLGRSASGAEDLAGNVAEWARGADGFEIRGGSYRTPFEDLGIWNVRPPEDEPAPAALLDVGFRCVRRGG